MTAQSIPTETIGDRFGDYVDEELIEKIWHDLGKQVPRDQIHQVAVEVAAEFCDVRVTTFVPVFIYRLTLERLSNLTRGKNEKE